MAKQNTIDWGGLHLQVKSIQTGVDSPHQPIVEDAEGTAGTGVTASDLVVGRSHTTVLTLADVELFATEPDAADLAGGALIFTLPTGAKLIESATFSVTVTKAGEATIADGEIALGTTVGSGADDALGDVDVACENIAGPVVVTSGEFDGAQVYENSTVAHAPLYVAAADDHTVYLNVAATWPDVTPSGNVTADGTVVIKWTELA